MITPRLPLGALPVLIDLPFWRKRDDSERATVHRNELVDDNQRQAADERSPVCRLDDVHRVDVALAGRWISLD